MRPIPQDAIDIITRWEGCKLKAYLDSVNVPTIGYGHIDGVRLGQKITQEQAVSFLRADLRNTAAKLARVVREDVIEELPDNRYAALLSFVFNLGANPGWTIWKKLNARAYDEIPSQMVRFNRAGGKIVRGLVNRRADEVKLWLEDEADDEVIPSHVTRTTPTPPAPAVAKPLTQSKSFLAAASSAVTAAGAGIGAVSKAVDPFADKSELVGNAVATLAVLGAVLAVVTLFLLWLKNRQAHR